MTVWAAFSISTWLLTYWMIPYYVWWAGLASDTAQCSWQWLQHCIPITTLHCCFQRWRTIQLLSVSYNQHMLMLSHNLQWHRQPSTSRHICSLHFQEKTRDHRFKTTGLATENFPGQPMLTRPYILKQNQTKAKRHQENTHTQTHTPP